MGLRRRQRAAVEAEPRTGFAFCEPVTASSLTLWHIRRLTDQGRFESGAADTPALCGREVSWDLGPEPVPRAVEILSDSLCPPCVAEYRQQPPAP